MVIDLCLYISFQFSINSAFENLNNSLDAMIFFVVEETDIIELEKSYWKLKSQSHTGKLDLDTLIPLITPPVPLSVCAGLFGAFDENRDNHIDFKEMACGISAACRGPLTERQKCKLTIVLLLPVL